MEPLDSEMEYIVHPSSNVKPGSRLNYVLILPILGVLLLLLFIAAAIFQFDLSNVVDVIMGLMTLMFFVMVALLFWALHPKAYNSKS